MNVGRNRLGKEIFPLLWVIQKCLHLYRVRMSMGSFWLPYPCSCVSSEERVAALRSRPHSIPRTPSQLAETYLMREGEK